MDPIEDERHEVPTPFRWWRSRRAHDSRQSRRNASSTGAASAAVHSRRWLTAPPGATGSIRMPGTFPKFSGAGENFWVNVAFVSSSGTSSRPTASVVSPSSVGAGSSGGVVGSIGDFSIRPFDIGGRPDGTVELPQRIAGQSGPFRPAFAGRLDLGANTAYSCKADRRDQGHRDRSRPEADDSNSDGLLFRELPARSAQSPT